MSASSEREKLAAAVAELGALPLPVGPGPLPVESGRRPRTMLDHARDALRARMTKDDLRLVLENTITYAASLEARVAEMEAPREDEAVRRSVDARFPVVAAFLTEGEAAEADGCPRNVIDGDVGGHFFKRGAFSDSPIRCVYCGAKKPESGGGR